MNPPRHDTPVPPTSGDVVVPLRPKPPAYAISSPSRPVIIEADVIEYLVRVPLEQRWRILSRVAMATAHEEPVPASSAPPPPVEHHSPVEHQSPVEHRSPSPPPPSMRQPMVVVPAPTPRPGMSSAPPPSQRPQLELVDQTREVLTPPPPPPSASTLASASAIHPAPTTPAPPPVASTAPPPSVSAARPHLASAAPPHSASAAPPRPSHAAPPRPTPAAPPPPASVAPPTQAPTAPPPPASAPAPRLAYSAPPPPPLQASDQAEELFEAMQELMQLETAPDGARFCLRVGLAAVPCLAALVHLRDPKTLELVVVHAEGPRADGLLKTRTPQTDALVARAARAGKPIVATYGAEPDAEKETCPRHAHFDPWSVVVVPVVRGGQLLGLLEMIDPTDGNPFHEQAQAALDYVAGRLGRFLADHPATPMA